MFFFLYFFRPKRSLNSKKYGVDLIHYTHATNTAVHSSTKVDGLYDYSCNFAINFKKMQVFSHLNRNYVPRITFYFC